MHQQSRNNSCLSCSYNKDSDSGIGRGPGGHKTMKDSGTKLDYLHYINVTSTVYYL